MSPTHFEITKVVGRSFLVGQAQMGIRPGPPKARQLKRFSRKAPRFPAILFRQAAFPGAMPEATACTACIFEFWNTIHKKEMSRDVKRCQEMSRDVESRVYNVL